jgi:hypothetical protein
MFGKFFKFFERKTGAYDALLGIGLQTAASIAVTPELALKCAPVYHGVSVRAGPTRARIARPTIGSISWSTIGRTHGRVRPNS